MPSWANLLSIVRALTSGGGTGRKMGAVIDWYHEVFHPLHHSLYYKLTQYCRNCSALYIRDRTYWERIYLTPSCYPFVISILVPELAHSKSEPCKEQAEPFLVPRCRSLTFLFCRRPHPNRQRAADPCGGTMCSSVQCPRCPKLEGGCP